MQVRWRRPCCDKLRQGDGAVQCAGHAPYPVRSASVRRTTLDFCRRTPAVHSESARVLERPIPSSINGWRTACRSPLAATCGMTSSSWSASTSARPVYRAAQSTRWCGGCSSSRASSDSNSSTTRPCCIAKVRRSSACRGIDSPNWPPQAPSARTRASSTTRSRASATCKPESGKSESA